MEVLGKKIITKEIIFAISTVIVFVCLFFIMLGVFRKDIEKVPMANFDQSETNPDHV
ncbi:MAG: hypothetical protein K8I03_07560 [Ignavibacteria bacterium]|nr:hypothetical protein [Ignavibacteria bacterium]